jgi:hypothetical protein
MKTTLIILTALFCFISINPVIAERGSGRDPVQTENKE